MRKKGIMAVWGIISILIVCMAVLTACDNSNPEDNIPKEYTIQYADDSGTHQITVTANMPYSLDVVPERTGYVFVGLFDAEVGGTQYVSSVGASLTTFADGKNIVLFPQFKAKEYTVVLDYQGANVTGSRQLTVAYGSSLPELPNNLTKEHMEFAGWFIKTNCEGVQIADEYGLVPIVSVINNTNFDMSAEVIYLYAGFEAKKLIVTCCFEDGMDTEEILIGYDTPVSQIITNTRVDGKAPLTWSKTQGGAVFNGKVTDDMVLYAVEYAPVIDLDTNGGNSVNSLVARAGSTIALPTPTKDLAKFSYWEDMQGKRFDSTTMPSSSISLKAVWQAKIVFDSNGGSDIDDISVAAGNQITLPTPEKENYIFAGWYTADKEKYTSTAMPLAGIKLKAGWYKEEKATITKISGNDQSTFRSDIMAMANKLTLDFSGVLPDTFAGNIKVDVYLNIMAERASLTTPVLVSFCFYSTQIISDSNLLSRKNCSVTSDNYSRYTYSFSTAINGNKIYCAAKSSDNYWVYISDYYYDLTYPDTSILYL